jgi:hypothetical protein
MFLLVHGSFTGVPVVTFPYVHIFHPSLVHPLHYSPFSLTPLLKMTSQFSMFHIHIYVESTSKNLSFFVNICLTV